MYYHPEIFYLQSVPEKIGSAFGLYAAATVLQRHLKKDITFKDGYTSCNSNVFVEFSHTSLLLHGHLFLIVILFATFPYTDVFPGQLIKHSLIVCALFPFHAFADLVYLT